MIIKLNQISPMYFVMLDEQGVEKVGVSSVSVSIARNGTSAINATQGSDFTWSEISGGGMPGLYLLTPSNTKFSAVAGDCVAYVKATGCIPTKRGYYVDSATASDLLAPINDLSDSVAGIPGAVWNVSMQESPPADTYAWLARMLKLVNLGRIKIDQNTNRMNIYEDDGATVALSFDLKDLDGQPVSTGATERVPV